MSAQAERWPRGLRQEDAARYVGVSEGTFRTMVACGDMPAGFKWRNVRLWDVKDLDVAFDALKGDVGPVKEPVWR